MPGEPAAQYLRMSTEHQKYSLDNQAHAISEFAVRNGLEVVATYTDAAKSGVTIRGRSGLKNLLADVVQGDAPYRQILVYDVSRWGRFQDPDQAAHYEFICREAGATVRYCTELFGDDGSPTAAIMKHIKRVMAGEFSRELSAKARAGQILGAQRGFKQGGQAPFGVRRQLVDQGGRPIRVLRPGERKAITSDRVVYVAGPEAELETVRRIFRWYGRDLRRLTDIVSRLHSEGYPQPEGAKWTLPRLKRLLRNEIYLGVYVFNRTHQPFGATTTANPEERWVRVEMLKPIVSRQAFAAAAARINSGKRRVLTDEELLRRLKRLAKRGRISRASVKAAKGVPSVNTLSRRFGSFARAKELVGQTPSKYFNLHDDGRHTSETYLVEGLRRLLATHGYLSGPLIEADPDLPSKHVYYDRFGSMAAAYRLAGWDLSQSEIVTLAKRRGARRRWPAGQALPS